MFRQSLLFAVLLATGNCRYILVEDQPFQDGVVIVGSGYFAGPQSIVEFEPNYLSRDAELEPVFAGAQQADPESVYSRVRRQAETRISVDGKTGNPEFSAKIPVARSDSNILSVTGSQSPVSRGFGLVLDNEKGHALSVSQKNIPEFGKQLTAAGKLNVLHTDLHNVDANAFVSKNMPTKFPGVPNFNTYGGGIDYTFNDKIGASLGAAKTDFLQRTDVSALGHLNLFKNKDTSFDFNAGATRSFSPFIPKSSWEPTFGFSLSKYW